MLLGWLDSLRMNPIQRGTWVWLSEKTSDPGTTPSAPDCANRGTGFGVATSS